MPILKLLRPKYQKEGHFGVHFRTFQNSWARISQPKPFKPKSQTQVHVRPGVIMRSGVPMIFADISKPLMEFQYKKKSWNSGSLSRNWLGIHSGWVAHVWTHVMNGLLIYFAISRLSFARCALIAVLSGRIYRLRDSLNFVQWFASERPPWIEMTCHQSSKYIHNSQLYEATS